MISWRLWKVATAVLALLAATFSGGGVIMAEHTSGGDLLPDLVTVAPREMEIKTVGGEKRLYFTNEVINQHTGVLEIFPQTFSGSDNNDCDGDGNASNDRIVSQRIFQDNNGNGIFVRGTDTSSRTVKAGCMVYHPSHNHWHFDEFTHYRLANLSGGTVSQGSKQSTYIEDTAPRYNLEGQPSSKYYGECASTRAQGLSVGWGDIYRSTLPDQYISIAGVANGEYCLFSTVNPDRRLLETNHNNNGAALRITINGSTVAASSNNSCPSSNPAPLPPSHTVYDNSLRWDNWSWSTTVNPNNTSPIYSGSRSMAVTYNSAWAGLSLRSGGLDTSSSSHLHFAIAIGGQPLSRVVVTLYGLGDDVLGSVDPTDYATGGANDWFSVSIPLGDLGADNATVTRVNIQDNTGGAQPTFYVDELGFLSQSGPGGGDPPPPPPPPASSGVVYDNALRWEDWSWGTSVNPGNTSPYTHLQFAINMGGQPLSGLQVSLYGTSGSPITQVNPQNYDSPAGGGWLTINIPLTALGGANTTITRVQVQNSTSAARPTFYIDDMSFTGDGGGEPPPPPPPGGSTATVYGDSLQWANWSWGSSLNPNATSPVFAGSNSLAVTYNSAWAGLSLHHSGLNTSSYTHLRFVIHLGGGQSLSSIAVSLHNTSDTPITEVNPADYDTSASGGWLQSRFLCRPWERATPPSPGLQFRRTAAGLSPPSTSITWLLPTNGALKLRTKALFDESKRAFYF
ncbi:MAG: hypothetical protein FJ320_08455 [SAR202 cluster bacterium]|nr:hypothetical protein [SAR202 cluster bacterium]